MTLQNDHDHHSDYDLRHLALYGVAAVVLLVFAWTLAH
jgi:hypothetical protein